MKNAADAIRESLDFVMGMETMRAGARLVANLTPCECGEVHCYARDLHNAATRFLALLESTAKGALGEMAAKQAMKPAAGTVAS